MKIRFSKTLAAILAATTVTAVSGISALADITTVVSYDYENYTYGSTSNAVTVTSTVNNTNLTTGQVTYLVATDPTATGGIKYIDQDTIGSDGSVKFEFTTTEGNLYGCNATAKFGSDCNVAVDTFTFNDGVDYFTTGTVTPEFTSSNVTDEVAYIYGKISGNVVEYGVKIGETKYPAMGTVEGTFCVALKGATESEIANAVIYAVDTDSVETTAAKVAE